MATRGAVGFEDAVSRPVADRSGLDTEEVSRLPGTQQRVVGVVEDLGLDLHTHHTHQTFATPVSTG
jgi:hypothetical protein